MSTCNRLVSCRSGTCQWYSRTFSYICGTFLNFNYTHISVKVNTCLLRPEQIRLNCRVHIYPTNFWRHVQVDLRHPGIVLKLFQAQRGEEKVAGTLSGGDLVKCNKIIQISCDMCKNSRIFIQSYHSILITHSCKKLIRELSTRLVCKQFIQTIYFCLLRLLSIELVCVIQVRV